MDLTKLPPIPDPRDRGPDPEPEPLIPLYAMLTIGLGMLVLLFTTAKRLIEFGIARVFGRPFTWRFTDELGNPLGYLQSEFVWGDAAMLLFGLAVMADGIAGGAGRHRAMRLGALGMIALATVVNAGYAVWMAMRGSPLPLYSTLATIIGAYLTLRLYAELQRGRR